MNYRPMVSDQHYRPDMPTSRDVAQYLINEHGTLDSWKLQKLVYFIEARHLARHDSSAFEDQIVAFADGPVAKDLWDNTSGQFDVSKIWKAEPDRLSETARMVANEIWDEFGSETGRTLRELTHAEPAWLEAREGLEETQPGFTVLDRERIKQSARAYLEALSSVPHPDENESLDDYLLRVAEAG